MKKKARPSSAARRPATQVAAPWTFLTNHAHVLWCLYREPESRLREVATQVGITERMVQRIVLDLASAGYLSIEKEGRRNRYHFQVDRPLRHPLEAHCQVGQMLSLLERVRG